MFRKKAWDKGTMCPKMPWRSDMSMDFAMNISIAVALFAVLASGTLLDAQQKAPARRPPPQVQPPPPHHHRPAPVPPKNRQDPIGKILGRHSPRAGAAKPAPRVNLQVASAGKNDVFPKGRRTGNVARCPYAGTSPPSQSQCHG
jgi:hypothetical protein